MRSFAAVLSAGLMIVGSSGVVAQKAAPPPPPGKPEDALVIWNASIDALTKKVWPSVVQILVTGYATRQSGRGETAVVGQQRSAGRWSMRAARSWA